MLKVVLIVSLGGGGEFEKYRKMKMDFNIEYI